MITRHLSPALHHPVPRSLQVTGRACARVGAGARNRVADNPVRDRSKRRLMCVAGRGEASVHVLSANAVQTHKLQSGRLLFYGRSHGEVLREISCPSIWHRGDLRAARALQPLHTPFRKHPS